MRLLLLPILLSFACLEIGTAQIQNTAARTGISLDGDWHVIVDPYEAGYYDYRYQPYKDGGMGANHKPQSKDELVEYDFDKASTLRVPGDWNSQRRDLWFYEGSVWYKHDFDYALKPGHRLFLWFGAANYRAIVFVNGTKLGEHTGGFTPFQFEITPLLRASGNFVIVKVDNQRIRDGVPTLMTDWWNYGGLTRSVRLIDVPDTFVEDYSVQLQKGSQTQIAAWVRVNGPAKRQHITIRIPEAGIAQTAVTGDDGAAHFAFDAKLALWSPESPKLYDVTVESDSDKVTDRIGFRSIEAKGRTIMLNGQPLRLRGVSIHAENPFRGGRVASEPEARRLLEWAKELDCNFVRLPHYPHDEIMTRLADEMGLLVWSEIPVYWTISWQNPDTYRLAEQQLTDMIARDKNRASVILWSVANETPLSDARLKFIGGLAEKARSLDPTRLITAALETHYVNGDTIVIDDPLGKYLDVVSSNEYIGWYDGKPEKIDRVHWQTPYEKPFVISEFGADAKAGIHGEADARWTEEYQADVYRRQVAMFKRIPFLNGTIAWVLVDFRSPRRPLAEIQDFYNRKGLLSDQSAKKQAFYILQSYYRSLDTPTLANARVSDMPKPSRDREGAISQNWKLVWHDEFDGAHLDSTKWTYVTGGNGWGNQELEYYTNRPDNVALENGELVIKALKEHRENRDYTSGRIVTLGKFSQTYGRFEARMKIPAGQGIWPAFWMLGDNIRTDHWPECGEIDIMENIGREPAIVHGTIHGPGYSGGKAITSSYTLPANLSIDYHVFAVEWEPSAIRWYIDDKLYKTMTPADLPAGTKWVFDHQFHILLNLAVGGSWPGNPDASTNFPAYLYVDYVRVYARP